MSAIKKTPTDAQQTLAASLALQDPSQILPKTAAGTTGSGIPKTSDGASGSTNTAVPKPLSTGQVGYNSEMDLENKGDTYDAKAGLSSQDNAKFIQDVTNSALGFVDTHQGSDIGDFAKQEVAKLAKAGVTMDASTIEQAVKEGVSKSAAALANDSSFTAPALAPNDSLTGAMTKIDSLMKGFNTGATNNAMKTDLNALYKAAQTGDMDAYKTAAAKVYNDFDNVGKMKGGSSADMSKFQSVMDAVDQGGDALSRGGRSSFKKS